MTDSLSMNEKVARTCKESSFHGMISSFHAVFGLRQRDKSAKVIDYNDQVIRVREYLLLLGIPSPHDFSAEPKFPTEPTTSNNIPV